MQKIILLSFIMFFMLIFESTKAQIQDSVYFITTFKKQNCKDSTGTLSVTPFNGAKPYKVYVQGQVPNLQDSSGVFVFKNVKENNTFIRVEDNGRRFSERFVLLRDSAGTSITRYQYFINSCDSVGQLSFYSFGGIPPYKYELDGVLKSDSVISNVKTGFHTLVVTDFLGCRETQTFTLKPKGVLIQVESVPITCTDTVPAIKLNVSGGQAPYQYYVNRALKSSNTFKLNTGYYKIMVRDANGCSDSLFHYVWPQKDSLIVKTTFVKPNCIDSIGTLSVQILNANVAQFIDYQLDNALYSTNLTFPNVKIGYHTLKARNTEGCILETSFYLLSDYIYLPPKVDICFKKDSTYYLVAPTNYYGQPYSYSWSNGTTGSSYLVSSPGIYELTVSNSQGCTATTQFNVESCVWSGDTDTSGVVDNRDFLNIGLAYNETGFKRDSISTQWYGLRAKPWSKQTPTATNYKHIDTNGDGLINASDTMAILQNWSRKHNLVSPKGDGTSPRGAAPAIYVKTDKITEGVNALPIIFGESATQATGVYGLAYSIDFDENIIDENSVYVVFNNSWFGNNDKMAMYKVQDGKVHIALTKTNKININGAGQIAQLYFKVRTGKLNQNVIFKTENPIAINNNAQEIPTQTQTTNASVTTSINDTYLSQSVQIYPNPASDNLTIETQDLQLKEVSILDLTGRIIQSYKTENKRFEIPLNQQVAGSYFVKIMTDKGTVVKRFVKM